MSNIYKPDIKELHKLIQMVGDDGEGATLLIPDLQREYVWQPKQIILLADSLIRGWPFGTLLLWEVEELGPTHIPARPFWKVYDRTSNTGQAVTHQTNLRRDEKYLMALDGQQRLQSLYLAVGDKEAGIIDFDYAWVRDEWNNRWDSRSAKKQVVCPKACLYIDLESFLDAYNNCEGNIASIDYTQGILKWALNETESGEPFKSKFWRFPLMRKRDYNGQFIRFSEFWKKAADVNSNDDFETFARRQENGKSIVCTWLERNHVAPENVDKYLISISKLLLTLRDVRKSDIAYLKLLGADTVGIADKEAYNNIIVSIFTRMNNGGKALESSEITFAWLKRGWDNARTEGNDARKCFLKCKDELKKSYGVLVSDEDLLTGIGLIYAMLDRNGSIVKSSDLLDGKLINNYAKTFCENWQDITYSIYAVMKVLKERNLFFRKEYHSLYSVSLLWAWRTLARKWENLLRLTTSKADAQLIIDKTLSVCADRWILCSPWSRYLLDNTIPNIETLLKELGSIWKTISNENDPSKAGDRIIKCLYSWPETIQEKAKNHIDTVSAESRQ
jgi:hypothetical protein